MKFAVWSLVGCLVVGCVVATAGCSQDDSIEVSGHVTYDGEPVQQGAISFIPLDSGQAANGTTIEDGKFTLRVSPGSKRVEIRGSRALPPERQPNPEMGTIREDFIPAIYNRESTLTAEVTADGQREFTFDLTTP